jgi:site-specific DNA recombinase
LVDSLGNEGPTAKKDTHYAIREDEARVVRFIYNKVLEGHTLRQISVMLDGHITPPGRFAHWDLKMLQILVRNPVYKGEFVANRSQQIKLVRGGNPDSLTEGSTRTVLRKTQRPRGEWVIISVPAIVSTEIWEQANQRVNKPALTPKHTYLLTGLLQCATCNYSFGGAAKRYMKSKYRGGPKFETWMFYYRCSSRRGHTPAIRKFIGCNQLTVSAHLFDDAVWSKVYEVLLYPDILLGSLEREFRNDQNEQLRQQIAFLEEQIREASGEDVKLYRAYLAGAFDEVEYAEQRKALKDGSQNAASQISQLNNLLMTPEQYDERKREIMLICQNATISGLTLDAPFEIRKRIIHTIIDRIILNVNEGWFELNGIFQGRYRLPADDEDIEIENDEEDGGANRGGRIVCNPKRLAECFSGLRRWMA